MAPVSSTVLIEGESGTGKELVARAMHRLGPRRGRPFIAVNVGALPETLLESELFGHEKGAFTGAAERRLGRFELADTGTLFLDEIGDIPRATQVKLLRVLEEREVTRVGGTQPIPIDVRVITATNRPLRQQVEEGTFRPDLYYRLNVLSIYLPPLRERREDIPLLVQHFLITLAGREGVAPRTIAPDAVEALSAMDWPGNVRELRNTVERLLILAAGPRIVAADVTRLAGGRPSDDPGGLGMLSQCATFEEFKRAAERAFLLAKLRAYDWNVSETARALDMPRSNLYKKIERYALARDS
jgi:two-component system nitrogen regulation response regulator NtrX